MKKSILILFSFISFSFVFSTGFAQKAKKIQTAEFEVPGVCKMCKARIENAALIKGVKLVEWEQSTQMLKVIYKTKKTSLEQIHNALAKAGHRTDKVEADPDAYKKLPGCCLYDDGVESH